MLYSKSLTFTAGTTEGSAQRLNFIVNKGIISRAWLIFPSGCAGLVKIRVYSESHPIIPVNKSDYIKADDYVFDIPLFFEIKSEPYVVTLEGWNEDETYSHTITLLLLILPKNYVLPVGATEGILEGMKSLVIRPLVINQPAAAS